MNNIEIEEQNQIKYHLQVVLLQRDNIIVFCIPVVFCLFTMLCSKLGFLSFTNDSIYFVLFQILQFLVLSKLNLYDKHCFLSSKSKGSNSNDSSSMLLYYIFQTMVRLCGACLLIYSTTVYWSGYLSLKLNCFMSMGKKLAKLKFNACIFFRRQNFFQFTLHSQIIQRSASEVIYIFTYVQVSLAKLAIILTPSISLEPYYFPSESTCLNSKAHYRLNATLNKPPSSIGSKSLNNYSSLKVLSMLYWLYYCIELFISLSNCLFLLTVIILKYNLTISYNSIILACRTDYTYFFHMGYSTILFSSAFSFSTSHFILESLAQQWVSTCKDDKNMLYSRFLFYTLGKYESNRLKYANAIIFASLWTHSAHNLIEQTHTFRPHELLGFQNTFMNKICISYQFILVFDFDLLVVQSLNFVFDCLICVVQLYIDVGLLAHDLLHKKSKFSFQYEWQMDFWAQAASSQTEQMRQILLNQ